ncbi:glycosyltransferase [Microbacterium sp. MMO-20]|uniref:glycosyltransferase n=1 Tax=unclassified Microbacterium TaxID=2609290 RepID=UPI003FA5EDE2
MGPLPHADVLRQFEDSDLFVFPCQWDEPFGMVAVEAMSRGCIPVVIGRGGLAEVVQGAGHVISPLNADPISEMVAYMSELCRDPSLLEAKRRECVIRADEFNWDRVAHEMDRMIEEISLTVDDKVRLRPDGTMQ